MAVYKPKVIEGKINGTGWPIDGHLDIESTAIDCGIVFLTREEAESALKDREIKL